MKKITTILAVTSLASSPAIAYWDEKYFATESLNSDFTALIVDSHQGFDNVYFIIHDINECKATTNPYEIDSAKVNGRNVRLIAACATEGSWLFYPKTRDGARHTIDQFKNSKSVRVGSIEFSAKGFTKAYELFKSKTTAI